MFDHKGYLVIEQQALKITDDERLEVALEAGTQDLELLSEGVNIYTTREELTVVKEVLTSARFLVEHTKIPMIFKKTYSHYLINRSVTYLAQ